MHSILKRQLRKYLGSEKAPEKYTELFKAISMTYEGFDKDRDLIERSLEISSKELTEKNERLKALDKEKDSFISIAAHELKTPLTSIKGFAQLMHKEEIFNNKNKRKHYFELIDKNADRLANLINL